MHTDSRALDQRADQANTGDRVASYTFSYLLAIVLLGSLLWVSGWWIFLGNTRLLDTLINAGVVAYTDAQAGFVKGIPDLKLYLKAQDPIKWGLVELAGGIFILFWLIKAVQFHAMTRYYGVKGTFTQHARFYLHGIGINRLLPFNQGNVSIAKGLVDQGASPDQAAFLVYLAELFVIFEIVVYALIGLPAVGWTMWLGQMFWALVMLGICYALVRTSHHHRTTISPGSFKEAAQAFGSLIRRPWAFGHLAGLSLLAFGLEDVAAYLIAMAFTGTHVILNVQFSTLLMAIVASYIARLIPVTPGGIGQFEWGFAAALYIGGVGLPECAAIAILDNLVRYVSGTLLLAWVYILRIDYAFDFFKDFVSRSQPKVPAP